MSASTPSRTNPAARRPALKDPLRAPARGIPPLGTADTRFDFERSLSADISGLDLRTMEISEFADWLRTQTNKNKLPFQERAVEVYAPPILPGRVHREKDPQGVRIFDMIDMNIVYLRHETYYIARVLVFRGVSGSVCGDSCWSAV